MEEFPQGESVKPQLDMYYEVPDRPKPPLQKDDRVGPLRIVRFASTPPVSINGGDVRRQSGANRISPLRIVRFAGALPVRIKGGNDALHLPESAESAI